MAAFDFTKMHGLGNDFVVLDRRTHPLAIDPATARSIADRRTGIGCDQLLTIDRSSEADAAMHIWNADGGEVEACGNGARCVAAFLMAESGRDAAAIQTRAGLLFARRSSPDQVTLEMGTPGTDWTAIPLSEAVDTLHAPVSDGPLRDPVCTSMGNPHATFFVDDVAAVDLARHGPILEHHHRFPERANIGIAEVRGRDRLRVRVWERGVGETRACGTGACAAAVAAIRRGLTERRVTVELTGGALAIEWPEDGAVLMTGPVATSFAGAFEPAALTGAQGAEAAE